VLKLLLNNLPVDSRSSALAAFTFIDILMRCEKFLSLKWIDVNFSDGIFVLEESTNNRVGGLHLLWFSGMRMSQKLTAHALSIFLMGSTKRLPNMTQTEIAPQRLQL
jgi:hypothetical protein